MNSFYGETQNMMDKIRSAASHVAVKIIFAIIILCFIFTGVGFLGFGGGHNARDEQQYIAKIDGEGISREAFESQARQVTANVGSVGSDQSQLIRQMRQNVLAYQINNFLSYKFSEQLKAAVSNDQIKNAIRDQQVFHENGKFSNKKYLELLASNGYTTDSYAEILRAALQQQQVIGALVNTEFALPVDSDLSLLKDQKRKVYITTVNPTIVNMDDVTISTDDEQKYYDEHQTEFNKKERVKFKYLANFKNDILSTITVSDDELKSEYNKNIKQYSFPAKSAYSVIYVTSKEKADDILDQLKQSDFDEIAKTINKDNQISPYGKNGSLGWFEDNDLLPQPFKEANLKKAGDISQPIAVDGGFLIVKLDDMQKAKTMNFDYAKHQIKETLTQQKVDKIFEEQENKLKAAMANSSSSLEEIAEKSGLKLVESDWTYFNDSLSVLRYPEVRDVAFGGDMLVDGAVTNKISDIIPVGKSQVEGDIVIQVVDYRPEGVAPFDEVKEGINKKLYQNIANERFNSTVTSILEELNEKGSAKNVGFAENYLLSRDSTELPPKVVDMIFNLVPSASTKRIFGAQMVDDKTAYIAVITNVMTPDEKRDISPEISQLFSENIQNALLVDIRSKAKIEIMPNSNL